VKTILKAMRTYGMYVNDNGGFGRTYFQFQSESQVQYASLGAPDAWFNFAKKVGEANGWVRYSGAPDDPGARRVGKFQGEPPKADAARRRWADDWKDVWRRLVVINPTAIPGYMAKPVPPET